MTKSYVNANGIRDKKEAVKMNHQIMIDPLVVEFFSACKDIDEWVKPKECLHIWTAKIPQDIEEGSHILKISTTDSFGQTFNAYQIFEVK